MYKNPNPLKIYRFVSELMIIKEYYFQIYMKKIIVVTGTAAGSWIGWWIGSQIGLMTAFILSMVGTGLGLYFSRRFTQS